MKRSTILRKTRIKPVSPKRKTRVGKLGIVRLVGADLEALRLACFERDEWKCRGVIKTSGQRWRRCGVSVVWDDGIAALIGGVRGEMAHIRTKRNNGDTLDNVRTLCAECHRREHNPKVVPPKR